MDSSTPGFPVLHYLLEFAQTHVHWVSDAIQPSHPLPPPLLLLPIFPSIRVFSNESTLRIRWPKCWSLSFSISPSNEYSGWYPLGLIALLSLQSKGLFRSSPAPQFKSINSSAFSLLHGPNLTSTWWLEKPLLWLCCDICFDIVMAYDMYFDIAMTTW